MNTTPEDEPIKFGDSAHPTMATKITRGWIHKKVQRTIKTVASRTRLKLFGSLNLETMSITIDAYPTIDSQAMTQHFKTFKEKYPKARRIHLILDNAPYNKSAETLEAARECGIQLHFLPPYSPNLNAIEPVWRVMNECVRNNVVFNDAAHFKESIMNFFHNTWESIKHDLVNTIHDNFRAITPASSS